ncbi:MAG TPA: hypothetical protein VNU19_14405, partial [Candidatus Acidoferrum sp.]|nr:hypothetical protein [Candidatus Acidoferrum sp.]
VLIRELARAEPNQAPAGRGLEMKAALDRLLIDIVVEGDQYRRRRRDVDRTSKWRVVDDLGRVAAARAD